MTLHDLEWQGLLVLPKKQGWKTNGGIAAKSIQDLTLQRIQMWGFGEDNDTGVSLFCEDASGQIYEAEISQFSDCLSRSFMSRFLVEHYDQKIVSIFDQEMKLDSRSMEYVSIFATEFTRPGLADMRCAHFAKQEAEEEAREKGKLRLPSIAVLRRILR